MYGVQIPELVPGTPDWCRTASASKIAGMLGHSAYQSPYSVWHTMAGHVGPEPDNATFRRGHYLEPSIASWFADEFPGYLVEPGGCWAHPDHMDRVASPDRMLTTHPDNLATLEPALLELKSSGEFDHWGKTGTDEIPDGYKVQVLYQMWVTGCRVGYVAAILPYLEFRWYRIDWDQAAIDYIVASVDAFLDTLPGRPNEHEPDLDESEATVAAVQRRYMNVEKGEEVEVTETIAAEYLAACDAVKAADGAKRKASAALLAAMGDKGTATCDGVKIANRQRRGEGVPYLVKARNTNSNSDKKAA